MENAAEALKIAGFTLLFVAALSIAIITVLQGKTASESVIKYSDKTSYYSYVGEDENGNVTSDKNRTVSVYDIIPTLYRYAQEEYIIIFEGISDINFNGYTDENKKDITGRDISRYELKDIHYLNSKLESDLQVKWMLNYKQHIDYVSKQLLNNYSNEKFIEKITTTKNIFYNEDGQLPKDGTLPEENEEIRVIIYTLI